MTGLLADLKFALRTLSRSPLFACVAILSLGLGIGANTAIFTLLDQLMLRLLPVSNPEQLVMIWTKGPHNGSNWGSRALSYPMYQDFQQKAPAFESVFCRRQTPLSVTFDGQTERVNAELVSGNFFAALGVGPAAGRVFSPELDDRQYKGHPHVVLNHDYWITRFGGKSDVIGKKILVNNFPMTIVGVSAAGFHGLDPSHSPQLRVPIQMTPVAISARDNMGDRRTRWVQVFARMKPGQTVESTRASLEPLFKQIINEEVKMPAFAKSTDYNRKQFLTMTTQVEPAATGYSQMREQSSKALIVLMCMVGLVLLIACANVANLLIARAMARQKEIAVRLSVGASRGQLVRQLLIESTALALIGGAAGLFLSFWTTKGLLAMLPQEGTPLVLRAEPDARILIFTFVLSLATGIIFGLIPALKSTRLDLWSTLKDVVGAIAGGGSSAALRKSLVAAQVALSFLLLFGAGLFVRSLQNLKEARTGFEEIGNLVKFEVAPALNGYSLERQKAFFKQVLEDVRTLPGVKSAGYSQVQVLAGDEWDSTMSVEGHQAQDGEDMQAFMNALSPGYFKAMGVDIVEGRDFDDRDTGKEVTAAIVNRKFATHFFGDKSALGRHVGFGGNPGTKLPIEIIGVTEDTLYEGPRQGVRRQVFIPHAQSQFPSGVAYYVRAGVDSSALFQSLRGAVKKIDPAMPVYDMATLEGRLDQTLLTERLIAILSACFGFLATLLAAIGLYGVMAFVVTRRTKEIGVRMALGANSTSVLWLVMKEVLLLLGIGLAIGIPTAIALGQYVASQLFGIKPHDPLVAGIAIILLVAVASLAGIIPARRASRVDPMLALRYE